MGGAREEVALTGPRRSRCGREGREGLRRRWQRRVPYPRDTELGKTAERRRLGLGRGTSGDTRWRRARAQARGQGIRWERTGPGRASARVWVQETRPARPAWAAWLLRLGDDSNPGPGSVTWCPGVLDLRAVSNHYAGLAHRTVSSLVPKYQHLSASAVSQVMNRDDPPGASPRSQVSLTVAAVAAAHGHKLGGSKSTNVLPKPKMGLTGLKPRRPPGWRAPRAGCWQGARVGQGMAW